MAVLTALEHCMDRASAGGTTPPAASSTDTPAQARFDAEAMPHLNDIFRAASRILGDRSRAEDVTQEVYLQAWKSFSKFEIGTNCKAWLYRILFNCLSHHRRKWFRFPLLKESEEFLAESIASRPPVPERLTDEEILRALDGLNEDFRSIVMLVDVEEFSYREAAEILRIPIGTVMSRLNRARRLLREELSEIARSYGIGRTSLKEKGA